MLNGRVPHRFDAEFFLFWLTMPGIGIPRVCRKYGCSSISALNNMAFLYTYLSDTDVLIF